MEMRSSANYIWNVKDLLGQGATGAVYKGRSKRNGSEVAIKTTNHVGMMRPVEVRKREFEVLSKLNHENIVKIYASETELRSQGEIIVMELCNGGSLYTLLEHPSNAYGFSEKDCIEIIKDVVAGMEHLRQKGIVHRDLKPGNIMRVFKDDNTCVYKLTDFGAARELMHSDQFVSIYGTEEYLDITWVHGDTNFIFKDLSQHPDLYERGVLRKHSGKTFGANVDLWSIGVTIYHIATGKLPFRPHGGRQNKDTMYQITTTKKSGMISGVQKTEGGIIEWSDKLPDNTQLSPGFQELLTPIIAGVLESTPANMMSFPDFFSKVQDLVSRKVIEVYHAESGSFHRIYIRPNEVFANFQERVAKETGVRSPVQKFYVNGELFNPHSKREASKYPSSTREHPMILMGGEFVSPEYLQMRKIPLIAPIPNDWTLEGDATIAKIIANSAFSCKFSVNFYEDTIKTMASALDCSIKSLKFELLSMRSVCSKMEGRRSTLHHMTKIFCNSHENMIRLTEDLLSHVQLPQEESLVLMDEISMMKSWIVSKRKSDEELSKTNQFLDALSSVVTEVVDKDCLSTLFFEFTEETSKRAFYAEVSNLTSKIEDIYTRFRKEKHQRRLSVPDETNHLGDRKKLGSLIDKVNSLTRESFEVRVFFHEKLQKSLTEVRSYQEKAYRQQQRIDEIAHADDAHLLSLETTQMECQERYQKILQRIKQAWTSSTLSSVGTDVPSLAPANDTTNQETEKLFLMVENQIKELCSTTEISRKTAKENMDQLKKLKSSYAEFYSLLDKSGIETVRKLQELQAQQVLKDMGSEDKLISF